MGRTPSRSNNNEANKREAWTDHEDKILASYIRAHGEGKWKNIPKLTGLRRCGKSCRLRWMNYLRPDIKRGNITQDEEDLILRLHNLLGNRWSLIAGRLPGRTDNEIKNYWNTNLARRRSKDISQEGKREVAESIVSHGATEPQSTQVVLATSTPMEPRTEYCGDSNVATGASVAFDGQSSSADENVDGALMDFVFEDVDILEFLDFDFTGLEDFDMLINMDDSKQEGKQSDSQSLSFSAETNAAQENQNVTHYY